MRIRYNFNVSANIPERCSMNTAIVSSLGYFLPSLTEIVYVIALMYFRRCNFLK